MFKKDKTVAELESKVQELEKKLESQIYSTSEWQDAYYTLESQPSDFFHFTHVEEGIKPTKMVRKKSDVFIVYQKEGEKCQIGFILPFEANGETYSAEESLNEIKKRLGIFY